MSALDKIRCLDDLNVLIPLEGLNDDDSNRIAAEALEIFDRLTEFPDFCDSRIGWAHEIDLYAKASAVFNKLGKGAPDIQIYNLPILDYATILSNGAIFRIDNYADSFGESSTVLTDPAIYHAYLNSKRTNTNHDPEYYLGNPEALNSIVFEEQLELADKPNHSGLKRYLDEHGKLPFDSSVAQTLNDIWGAINNPSSNQSTLEQHGKELDAIIENLVGQSHDALDSKMPISLALALRSRAQLTHDLGLSTATNVTDIVPELDEAISDLSTAEKLILSALNNNPKGYLGLDITYRKIMYFQNLYSEELSQLRHQDVSTKLVK